MAKVYLKFRESVIREIVLPQGVTTVGRAGDNDIAIDNLAVSGHHARIVYEGGRFLVEDLGSTNGTYVHGRRIARHQLTHHAEITIGKHTLLFVDPVPIAPDADQTLVRHVPAACDATVVLSPLQPDADADRTIVRKAPVATDPAPDQVRTAEPLGRFTVLDGSADQSEFRLERRITTIGKADGAEIRLKGFFAPKIAAVVNRTREGYSITPAGGERKVLVNGRPVGSATPLRHLDLVEVASLRLQFCLEGE
jgi:pSer/pThr/pTyr-binding forkhead associated (FHA) protein